MKPEDKGIPPCVFLFFTMLYKIASLPPSGLGKQGGPTKKKLQYPVFFFWGGRGTSKNVTYIFGGRFLVGGARGVRKCKLDLSNVKVVGHCEPLQ